MITLLCALYVHNALAQFKIETNIQSGAINSISNVNDPHQMNWIFSSSEKIPWQKPNRDWGLGEYQALGVNGPVQWTIPQQNITSGNQQTLTYHTTLLDVEVKRFPENEFYIETYTFKNNTNKPIKITDLRIFTPFNDNYPDAKTCATNRCNAHIWTGMNASYVNATRMNGFGPHLGLVLIKGALQGYSNENRSRKNGSSNSRGTLTLNVAPFSLKPGQTYSLQWKMFWHKDWNDFFQIAKKLGFVRIIANKLVISMGEKITLPVDAIPSAGLKQSHLSITGTKLGEHSQKVYFDQGKKYTWVNYLVISSPEDLLKKRAKFIVNHQQMNDTSDQRYRAYMVYDNELNEIVTDASGTVSPFDRNEGAERLGMGVFIARWLQFNQDEKIKKSLLNYVNFVRTKLQDKNYGVFSDVKHTSRNRGYNYPWVASLYLEVYKLTRNNLYLNDYYHTLRKFFSDFKHHFYGIDIRIKDGIDALNEAGMHQEKKLLLEDFKIYGDFILKNGIYYPEHEVNYEQSIVAPAITALCELYLTTNDKRFLEAAEAQMPSLESFHGKQPDVHLHDIGIRHWDGYWFGKKEFLGDTMPHYWSALSAVAFYRYFQCTQQKSYQQRAVEIVKNNLLNFKEDGRASCAYLYAEKINGKPGKFYDPYANDQDWALVYYLDIVYDRQMKN